MKLKSFAESLADMLLEDVTISEIDETLFRLNMITSFERTSDGHELFSERQVKIIEAALKKVKAKKSDRGEANETVSSNQLVEDEYNVTADSENLESMVEEIGVVTIETCVGQYELLQKDILGYVKTINQYQADLNQLVKDLKKYELDVDNDYYLRYVQHKIDRPPVYYANAINRIKELRLASKDTRFVKNQNIVSYCGEDVLSDYTIVSGFDMYGNLIQQSFNEKANALMSGWRDIHLYNADGDDLNLSNAADYWTYFMWRNKVYLVEFDERPETINIIECDFKDSIKRKTILTKKLELPEDKSFLDLHCFALKMFICEVLN